MNGPTRRRSLQASTSASDARDAAGRAVDESAAQRIVVVATDAASQAHAAAIAAELGAAVQPPQPADLPGQLPAGATSLRLLVAQAGCELVVPGFAQPLRIALDDVQIRRRAASGRRLELLRACGWPVQGKRILDATAGLGRDAFVLACAGATVDMIEREALLLVLLRDALARAEGGAAGPGGAGVRTPGLIAGDATARLPEVYAGHDVIYLDPMFEREGSALPQRDAQLLARLARSDPGEGLLAAALALRPPRVVVKRARTQPALAAQPAPHHRIVGRRVRFDVYLPG